MYICQNLVRKQNVIITSKNTIDFIYARIHKKSKSILSNSLNFFVPNGTSSMFKIVSASDIVGLSVLLLQTLRKGIKSTLCSFASSFVRK